MPGLARVHRVCGHDARSELRGMPVADGTSEEPGDAAAGERPVTVLAVDDQQVFRDAVLQKMPTRALQQVAIKQGMRTLFQNGLKRVAAGTTTLEEVLRVITVDQM